VRRRFPRLPRRLFAYLTFEEKGYGAEMKKEKPSKQLSSRAPAAAKTASGLDLGAVRELALIAEEFGLAEVEVDPSGHIRISRRVSGPATWDNGQSDRPAPVSIGLAPPAPVESAAPGTMVTSPFVGTFYRAPSPDSASFVELGQSVKKGQVVCIVEAMKLMNEIEAEGEGKVAEFLVKNGEHVEYGQALIRLTPA
jgi:acetyl-CoA carboxylase biotin carboxyl carrier protein